MGVISHESVPVIQVALQVKKSKQTEQHVKTDKDSHQNAEVPPKSF
jgi:hypothetical protein